MSEKASTANDEKAANSSSRKEKRMKWWKENRNKADGKGKGVDKARENGRRDGKCNVDKLHKILEKHKKSRWESRWKFTCAYSHCSEID